MNFLAFKEKILFDSIIHLRKLARRRCLYCKVMKFLYDGDNKSSFIATISFMCILMVQN